MVKKRKKDFFDDQTFRKKLEDELESIKQLEKKVRLLKRSDFYRTLQKTANHHPHPTRMYVPRYKTT